MSGGWKEIWNEKGKDFHIAQEGMDEFAVYRELKRLDGFDVGVGNGDAYYRNFYNSAAELWEYMKNVTGVKSAYEVGCGSGANLYLLKNRGVETGGIDYSVRLADIAGSILGENGKIEVGEAACLRTDNTYDLVFSDSVFAYFPNEEYGWEVLERMYQKAAKAVAVLEVFDKAKQSECEARRRSMVDDYDKKYQGLDKVFYDRDMFVRFSKEHPCRIAFSDVKNREYWNSEYLFHCFLFK